VDFVAVYVGDSGDGGDEAEVELLGVAFGCLELFDEEFEVVEVGEGLASARMGVAGETQAEGNDADELMGQVIQRVKN
jgi:hypothetical protein